MPCSSAGKASNSQGLFVPEGSDAIVFSSYQAIEERRVARGRTDNSQIRLADANRILPDGVLLVQSGVWGQPLISLGSTHFPEGR